MTSEDYSNSLPEGISKFLQEFYSTELKKQIINYILCNDDIGAECGKCMEIFRISQFTYVEICRDLLHSGIIVMNNDRYYPSKLTYLLMETFVEKALEEK